jgi:hypothetical protein
LDTFPFPNRYPFGNRKIHHRPVRFGYLFNQPLKKGVLPQSLQKLHFHKHANPALLKDVLPQSLRELFIGSFGDFYHWSIEEHDVQKLQEIDSVDPEGRLGFCI